jgi:hypothetical protein
MEQKPDNIVFVMDGSIGQAAYAQALAFKQRVPVPNLLFFLFFFVFVSFFRTLCDLSFRLDQL